MLFPFILSQPALANEGGQVSSEVTIEFYKDDEPDPEVPMQPEDITENFPSTGEVIRRSLALSGLLLIIFVLIVHMKRRHKRREKVDQENNTPFSD